MKRQTKIVFFGAVILTMACTLLTPTNQPKTDDVGTAVAGTMQALTAAAPPIESAPTESVPAQIAGIPVSFERVSFMIPIGLAGGADVESVPAAGENDGAPWDIAPAHLEFTLTGYQLQDKFHQPKIYFYPAQGYISSNPSADESISRLIAILRDTTPATPDNLPFVPFFNAGQIFAARITTIQFQGGSGVRFLTQYAQSFASVNNHDLFYHFQGLMDDHEYYIIAILPVTASMLAADENPDSPVPAAGVPFPGYEDPYADFNAYYIAVAEKLNAANADSFQPSLSQLDALIQSILIGP